jgi:CcmD family protein
VSDPSVPWLVAAYVVAFVVIGGYVLRLVVASRRARSRTQGGPDERLG